MPTKLTKKNFILARNTPFIKDTRTITLWSSQDYKWRKQHLIRLMFHKIREFGMRFACKQLPTVSAINVRPVRQKAVTAPVSLHYQCSLRPWHQLHVSVSTYPPWRLAQAAFLATVTIPHLVPSPCLRPTVRIEQPDNSI